MNKNAKKMYVAPSIREHVVELEQGIAAGSQPAQPGAGGVTVEDVEGSSGAVWGTDGF